jgi:Ni/Co efflux regulator RcnB
MRKFVALLAAMGMAAAPVAVHAQDASALSLSRVNAPMLAGFSYFQDDATDDDDHGGSTAVILGVVLLVLIGAAAISGDGGDPLPNSP